MTQHGVGAAAQRQAGTNDATGPATKRNAKQ